MRYQRVLSADENARAGRFTSPEAQQSFVLARGGLRILLGAQLSVPPESLRFNLGPQGKPSLDGAHADATLHFNVSHSGPWVLIGLSTGPAIGVDIEVLNATRPLLGLAARTFGTKERAAVSQKTLLDPQAFYQIWSAREAYLKAIGVGLAGWSGKDIALGRDGMISSENPDTPCVAYRLDLPSAGPMPMVGAVALSSMPSQFKAWRV